MPMSLPPVFKRESRKPSLKLGFNKRSTAEQVTAGIELTGKVILVTGVGSGIGKETLRVLSGRGAHVIGLDRTMEMADSACRSVEGITSAYACDLSSPSSIVECGQRLREDFSTIDVVVNNAGIMAPPHTVVQSYKEPLEIQFAVNFLGHFILTNQLLGLLQAAPAGRVVFVASEAYVTAPKPDGILFNDLALSQNYNGLEAYGHSKLATMLMNLELSQRLQGGSVSCNAVHPGLISNTNLAHDTETFFVKMIARFGGLWMRSIPRGAATQCLVATHPAVAGINGEHFADCDLRAAVGLANNMELAEKLWEKASDLAGDYFFSPFPSKASGGTA